MIEDVLSTVKSTLELYLPEELAKQDGKYADGIQLTNLAQILTGDETITEKGLPLAILKAEGAEINLWMTSKKDVSHIVTISVVVTDTNESISQKRLWRTMRAIENCLEIHLPGTNNVLDYVTTEQTFNVNLFDIDESKSTEKGGVITATIMERQDAYKASQV